MSTAAAPSMPQAEAPGGRTPVLEARELSRHYQVRRGMFGGHATLKAVEGASFTLQSGRTLAVVGESGCGKSTLARMVTLIEAPTSGHLRLCGTDVAGAGAAELKRLRPLVQMVFQNPYGSLNPRQQVGTIIGEPLLINSKLGAAERRESVLAMMRKVGLRPDGGLPSRGTGRLTKAGISALRLSCNKVIGRTIAVPGPSGLG